MDADKPRKIPFLTLFPFTQSRLKAEAERLQALGIPQVEYSCQKDTGLKALIYGGSGQITMSSRYSLRKRSQRKPIGDLGLMTLEQARQQHRANRLLASQGIDPKSPTPKAVTLGVIHRDHYLVQGQSRQKKSLHTDISRYANWIGPEFGDTLLPDISVTRVNQFILKMQKAGQSASSIKKIIIQLGACLSLGVDLDMITKNVVKAVRTPKVVKQPVDFLTAAQLRSIYQESLRSDDLIGSSMIRLMMLTGARFGEVSNMEWDHVHLIERWWYLPTQKSGLADRIDLSEPACAAIQPLEAGRRNRYVFSGAKGNDQRSRPAKLFKRLCLQAGIPEKFTLHSLRHGWISAGINAGIPLEIMSLGARHAHPSTTRIYSHAERNSLISAQAQIAALITSGE